MPVVAGFGGGAGEEPEADAGGVEFEEVGEAVDGVARVGLEGVGELMRCWVAS